MPRRTQTKTATEATGAPRTRNKQRVAPEPPKSGGLKARVLDNLPDEVVDLLEKYNGNRTHAAHAIGYKAPTLFTSLNDGKAKYTDEIKERVLRALRGEQNAPVSVGRKKIRESSTDVGELGLAIVITAQDSLEQIMDAADPMGAKIVLRMNLIGDQVLSIYRIANPTMLRVFREFVLATGAECKTP